MYYIIQNIICTHIFNQIIQIILYEFHYWIIKGNSKVSAVKGNTGSESSEALNQLFFLFSYHLQVSLVCYYISSFHSIILTSLAKATSSVIFKRYFGFFITLTITEVTQSMQWLIYLHFICPCQNKVGSFRMRILACPGP